MIGLKKSAKNREANGMPSLPTWPTQFTLRENVGSLDAPGTAHLFILGPRVQRISLRGS